jgi:hypothetical protein
MTESTVFPFVRCCKSVLTNQNKRVWFTCNHWKEKKNYIYIYIYKLKIERKIPLPPLTLSQVPIKQKARDQSARSATKEECKRSGRVIDVERW